MPNSQPIKVESDRVLHTNLPIIVICYDIHSSLAEDRPIVVQFAASSAKELADAAELVAPLEWHALQSFQNIMYCVHADSLMLLTSTVGVHKGMLSRVRSVSV